MIRQLMFGMLAVLMLLGGVVTLINVRAQAPQHAQIAFSSNRDGPDINQKIGFEIYVMDVDGKNPRNLTNHPAFDGSPSWFDPAFAPVSPAGKLRGTWGAIRSDR